MSLRLAAVLCFILAPALFAEDPQTLIDQQHYKQAQAAAQKILAANPKDANALAVLSRVRSAYRDWDGAIRYGDLAVAANPNNAMAHAALLEAYGNKINTVGTFAKMSMAKKIKGEAEAALAIDPKNVYALSGLRQFHEEAPGIVGGDKKRVPELKDRLRAVDPIRASFDDFDEAYKVKDYKRAESILLDDLKRDPKNYDVLLRLSGFYSIEAVRDWTKVEKYARDAVSLDSKRSAAYSVLAQLFAQQEKWAQLNEIVPQAEKAVPDDLNPEYQAARVLANTGKDNARAERYLRHYLTQEPEGNRPSLAGAHWRLGLVLEKEGSKPQAVQEIETALRMDPALKDAEKDLKRLR